MLSSVLKVKSTMLHHCEDELNDDDLDPDDDDDVDYTRDGISIVFAAVAVVGP